LSGTAVPTGLDGDYWMRRSSRRMTSEEVVRQLGNTQAMVFGM
jgi:hypothetical protein